MVKSQPNSIPGRLHLAAGLWVFGTASGIGIVFAESRFHARTPATGVALLGVALCGGALLGFWLPHIAFRRRFRSAAVELWGARDQAGSVDQAGFAASLAAVCMLASAVAGAGLIGIARGMEAYRGVLTEWFVPSAWLTPVMLWEPLLTLAAICGALGAVAISTLHGWQRCVRATRGLAVTRGAVLTIALLLAGYLSALLLRSEIPGVLSLTALFCAAAVAAWRPAAGAGLAIEHEFGQALRATDIIAFVLLAAVAGLWAWSGLNVQPADILEASDDNLLALTLALVFAVLCAFAVSVAQRAKSTQFALCCVATALLVGVLVACWLWCAIGASASEDRRLANRTAGATVSKSLLVDWLTADEKALRLFDAGGAVGPDLSAIDLEGARWQTIAIQALPSDRSAYRTSRAMSARMLNRCRRALLDGGRLIVELPAGADAKALRRAAGANGSDALDVTLRRGQERSDVLIFGSARAWLSRRQVPEGVQVAVQTFDAGALELSAVRP